MTGTKFIKSIFALLLALLFVASLSFARTAKKDCQTKQLDPSSGCEGTITTCNTFEDRNGDGTYDYVTTWVHVQADCLIKTVNYKGNVYSGPFLFRNSEPDEYLQPGDNDIISDVIMQPFDENTDTLTWPQYYKIEYSDSLTNVLTGEFEKMLTDSIPLWSSYKSLPEQPSIIDNIDPEENKLFIQGLAYTDPEFRAMNIYPNPAIGSIRITFNFFTNLPADWPSLMGNSLDYLRIFNSNGEKAFEENNVSIKEGIIIDLGSFSSGTYIIEVGKNNINYKWIDKLIISK